MLFRSQALGLRPILRLLSSTPRRRCQLNSNVGQHNRNCAVLQQSQRLRREPNSHNAAGAAKHWPARASSEQWRLASTNDQDIRHLGSCEQHALRHQHEEAAAAHAKARAPPRQLPTRSVIGFHGVLRRCFNPPNYARAASSGATARFGATFMACSRPSPRKPTTSRCSPTPRST